MIFFFIIFLIPTLCILNVNGMIPGTLIYRKKQELRQARYNEESAKLALRISRIRLKESQNIDRMLAIGDGKK